MPDRGRTRAVGVDGWRGRWVAATVDGRAITWTVHDTFADVLAARHDTTVAVDMPIATTDDPRTTDEHARAWLREHGGPWQSIFLTPTTAIVAAHRRGLSHAEAMARRPAGTPGTSIQAWNLIPQMVDVRDAVATNSGVTVVEAHPECSFRLLDPRIGLASKKTGLGVGRRLQALRQVFDVDLADAPPDVPVDDLLDACAVAWTAQRVATASTDLVVLPAGAVGPPRIVV